MGDQNWLLYMIFYFPLKYFLLYPSSLLLEEVSSLVNFDCFTLKACLAIIFLNFQKDLSQNKISKNFEI